MQDAADDVCAFHLPTGRGVLDRVDYDPGLHP